MRDILYVFQGIDGKFIKMNAQENCYKIDGKVRTPASTLRGRGRYGIGFGVSPACRCLLIYVVIFMGITASLNLSAHLG